MKSLVKLNQVSKNYGSVEALRKVDLSLGSGRIIGLLGPNGSGKTTLIKILTGMIRNYKGKVFIEGQKRSYKANAIISYLPDLFIFDAWKSIKQIIYYFNDVYDDFNLSKCFQLLKEFQIDDRSHFKKLSKGNKEKLQLALVLSRDAKIYLFDEPIGGVDPVVRDIIIDTIMTYKNTDATVILSTHQIYDVENLFDEVIFLKQGKLLLHLPTKDLLKRSGKSLIDTFKEVYRHVR